MLEDGGASLRNDVFEPASACELLRAENIGPAKRSGPRPAGRARVLAAYIYIYIYIYIHTYIHTYILYRPAGRARVLAALAAGRGGWPGCVVAAGPVPRGQGWQGRWGARAKKRRGAGRCKISGALIFKTDRD